MVSMLILAMTVILSLRAVQEADHVAKAGEEIRQANVLLGELLDNGPRTFQVAEGQAGRFHWTVETQTTGSERPVAVCRRVVSLTNTDTLRRYASTTLETCPAQDGA
jgi:hypothetical protein